MLQIFHTSPRYSAIRLSFATRQLFASGGRRYAAVVAKQFVLYTLMYITRIPLLPRLSRPDEESESTEWETDTDASDDEEGDSEQARTRLEHLRPAHLLAGTAPCCPRPSI